MRRVSPGLPDGRTQHTVKAFVDVGRLRRDVVDPQKCLKQQEDNHQGKGGAPG